MTVARCYFLVVCELVRFVAWGREMIHNQVLLVIRILQEEIKKEGTKEAAGREGKEDATIVETRNILHWSKQDENSKFKAVAISVNN